MLKIGLLQALKPHEWLSLIGGVLVAGAIYVLLIHPSLESLAEVPPLREAKQAAQDELARTRAKLEHAEHQLAEGKALLAQLGGAPPPASQKDLQIARLTALADRCHVKINQYVPIDTVDYVDHRASMVEFVGQGAFLDITQLFSLIESTVDFVDVTNFAITVVRSDGSAELLATWSTRINGIRPEMNIPAPTAQRGVLSDPAHQDPGPAYRELYVLGTDHGAGAGFPLSRE